MSTQQHMSELLAFGYVHRAYNGIVSAQLIKLMQLFYDDWIYWVLKDDKLKQFVNTKYNEKIICPKSFKFKDIQFEMYSYPTGCDPEQFHGSVVIVLKTKHMSTNIESFEFYSEIKCEPLSCLYKQL
eukprot:148877_1